MRLATRFLPPPHHGFGARHRALGVHAVRTVTHWLRQATDRAIGSQLADIRCNPFLYLSPRC